VWIQESGDDATPVVKSEIIFKDIESPALIFEAVNYIDHLVFSIWILPKE